VGVDLSFSPRGAIAADRGLSLGAFDFEKALEQKDRDTLFELFAQAADYRNSCRSMAAARWSP
jgi:hypothetical protein